MRTALVCGASGFIGAHLVRRLKADGFWVRGADLKSPEFSPSVADDVVEKYVRYEYELQPWFAAMPAAMFQALERRFGWHYLITARPT